MSAPPSSTGQLNRAYGAGNFSKIWSVCGQHEIRCTVWRMRQFMYKYAYTYNLTCVFLYITCHKNILIIKENLIKNAVHNVS